ncbi:hypothetical protein JSE7799_00301 [Jannaschia seosinensis]|uniref:Uncharacterized protein n=1 Tax=Jannaschia seosinensis TaxID=313367 RepID=A0A0M7B8L9_9RHOB|nr:hypothetical protein JSE7799_00301 [Jannaschia seosinensis]
MFRWAAADDLIGRRRRNVPLPGLAPLDQDQALPADLIDDGRIRSPRPS